MKSRFFPALMVSALFIAGSAGAQANARPTAKAAAPTSTPAGAVSSTQTPGNADSARAYDSQALRYEARWGSADIKRGASGTVIGTVGWFRNFDVEQLVSS